jgi:starch phosphorylase
MGRAREQSTNDASGDARYNRPMRLRAPRTLFVERRLPPELAPLADLARDLWWSWHPEARELFERLDQALWEATGHNPYRLLQVVGEERLRAAAADVGYVAQLQAAARAHASQLDAPAADALPGRQPYEVVAYFSMEYGLVECLPSYSGGLGVLAGDHLKSANDLRLPLVGVGLLYRAGYFGQRLGPDGSQYELDEPVDVAHHPIERVRDPEGREVTVHVPVEDREVAVNVWRLRVGRVPLLLLNTDHPENDPRDRRICDRLYDADLDTRIRQEIVLGIGGVRALRALGMEPAVCHMNEGHSALLALERARGLMERHGLSFAEAWWAVWNTSVFTTHTAVAAGIDLFPPDLVLRHLGGYFAALGADPQAVLGLGRTRREDHGEPFSMALLGLRASAFANGVSRIHGAVSRDLWSQAWPNVPVDHIPIGSITNGVHLATWVGPEMGALYDRLTGGRWRTDPADPAVWEPLLAADDEELWHAHLHQRRRLLDEIERRMREEAVGRGELAGAAGRATIDPGALIIGFARRFAGYKRATLLFRDPDRLARIVGDPERPVVVVFAGKAHPRDEPAKQLIREVVAMSQRPEFRGRIVMLERYNLHLARLLVQGCDLWLNNPLRPLEASGTSGMKAAANGVLNASVPDGWWPEAYQPGIGWRIGPDDPLEPEQQDAFDAEAVYTLLEEEIVPAYFERSREGVPLQWTAMMKRAIVAIAPHFNTDRMVAEYLRRAYAPAFERWRRFANDGFQFARELRRWEEQVRAAWGDVKVLSVEHELTEDGAGPGIRIAAEIFLGKLPATDVRVDAMGGPAEPDGTIPRIAYEVPLARVGGTPEGVHRYEGVLVPREGGRLALSLRVVPFHPAVPEPYAWGLVLWA